MAVELPGGGSATRLKLELFRTSREDATLSEKRNEKGDI